MLCRHFQALVESYFRKVHPPKGGLAKVGTIIISDGIYCPLLYGCIRVVDGHSNLVMVNRDRILTLTYRGRSRDSERLRDIQKVIQLPRGWLRTPNSTPPFAWISY